MTTPAQNDGSGQGQGGADSGTGAGGTATQGGSGTGTGAPPADDWSDRDSWRSLADELGMTPDQVKEKIQHARTWEDRAKQNRQGAQKAQTLEQQLTEMREAQAERDQRDLERSIRTAKVDLRAALVDAGLSREDATDALELIDAGALIQDGEPDEKKIAAAAKRLAKVAGRALPDRDQGAGSGTGKPATMNDWVRQQVGAKRR